MQLDCEADGEPPPYVIWLKDGSLLDESMGAHLW